MKKSKSKSTPEFALQTGLGGNGDQVAALQGLNRRGNTKEQRKKAPAIGPKNTSPLKKGVAIDAFQKKTEFCSAILFFLYFFYSYHH